VTASEGEGRLRAFHERCARYRRHGHDRIAAARFVAGAASPLSGSVLDVGTGKGLLAIELARRGFEVVSVDPDSAERELAALLAEEAGVAKRINFMAGNGAHLPFPDGRFGCAAMMDVLHHVEEPEPILREMARVVRNGGRIVVADFDEKGFEIVTRVLREEGRVHERTGATVDLTEGLLSGMGCRRMERVNGCLHDVAVMQREPTRARR
jgi:ubiquinone/menaquinone biosynthesis C-methylase UbiE